MGFAQRNIEVAGNRESLIAKIFKPGDDARVVCFNIIMNRCNSSGREVRPDDKHQRNPPGG
jgi:hypothetical protein